MQRIKKSLGLKPIFPYLELHLADHCNMNCKGCGHFSPIAEKHFADIDEYKHDMQKLQTLFLSIHTIRLMGGEPLLNPQIEDFLFVSRSAFPRSDIQIATNGILLSEMSKSFWMTCKAYSVDFDITIYPPMKSKEAALIQLIKDNGLKVRTHSVTYFHAFYNKDGNTNSETAFKRCRAKYFTPMLRDGKIYICSVPATIDTFNKRYGLKVPSTGFVDIYKPGVTGWQVMEQLNKAATICKYCTIGWKQTPEFQWARSKRLLSEWDAEFATAEKATEYCNKTKKIGHKP